MSGTCPQDSYYNTTQFTLPSDGNAPQPNQIPSNLVLDYSKPYQCTQGYCFNNLRCVSGCSSAKNTKSEINKNINNGLRYRGGPGPIHTTTYAADVMGDCSVGQNPTGYSVQQNFAGPQFSISGHLSTVDLTPYNISCIPNIPQMTDTTIKYCCTLDPEKDKNLDPFKSCAPGYCLQGPNCTKDMARICQQLDSEGKWPKECSIYFSENSGLQAAKDSFTILMANQFSGKIYDSQKPNPFIKYALKYCNQYPGACDSPLQDYCSAANRGDMVFDKTLQKICPCFMTQDSQHYPFYKKGIPTECDSLCTIAQIRPSSNGQLLQCTETVCVIDDVTFNIANSNVGGIDFNMMCGNCGGAGCSQCYIDGVDINTINSNLNGGITINQECGQCLTPGPAGSVPTTCSGSPITPTGKSIMYKILIGCIAIFVVFLAITIYLYIKSKISPVKFAIIMITGLILLAITLVQTWRYSFPIPLPIVGLTGKIGLVQSIQASQKSGNIILTWPIPTYTIPNITPQQIMYTVSITDQSGKVLGVYDSLTTPTLTIENLNPNTYQCYIASYYETIVSGISALSFTVYAGPIVQNFVITSIKNGLITATGTIQNPPTLIGATGNLNIWVPGNDDLANPSFMFPSSYNFTTNTFTVTFPITNIAIARTLKYGLTWQCPGQGGKCETTTPVNMYLTPVTLGKSIYVGFQPNINTNALWIIDPVTNLITLPKDPTLKWTLAPDPLNNGYQYISLNNVEDAYSPFPISSKSNTAPAFAVTLGGSTKFTYPSLYTNLSNAECSNTYVNGCVNSDGNPLYVVGTYAQGIPKYDSSINLTGYKITFSATLENNFGSTQIDTPIYTM